MEGEREWRTIPALFSLHFEPCHQVIYTFIHLHNLLYWCVCLQLNLYKTGGGSPVSTVLTEFDIRVVGAFKQQFIPLENKCDDDSSYVQLITLPDEVRISCLYYCSIFFWGGDHRHQLQWPRRSNPQYFGPGALATSKTPQSTEERCMSAVVVVVVEMNIEVALLHCCCKTTVQY